MRAGLCGWIEPKGVFEMILNDYEIKSCKGENSFPIGSARQVRELLSGKVMVISVRSNRAYGFLEVKYSCATVIDEVCLLLMSNYSNNFVVKRCFLI